VDRLFKIVEQENIVLKYSNIYTSKRKINGLYLKDYSGPIIILDKRLEKNNRLHKCVLAEELGHHFTVPRTNIVKIYASYNVYNKNNEFIKMAQDERKALRWATDFIINDVDFCRAVKEGYSSIHELADYFEVTEWFVYQKIQFLLCNSANSTNLININKKSLFEKSFLEGNILLGKTL